MEDNLKDLQSLIAERAEKRLDKDIDEFTQVFRNHKFIEGMKSVLIGERGNAVTLATLFWDPTSQAMEQLKSVLLPKYIEEETRLFVDKVYNLDQNPPYVEEEEEEEIRPAKKAYRKY